MTPLKIRHKSRVYFRWGCWLLGFGCPIPDLWMMSVGPLRIELGNLKRTPQPRDRTVVRREVSFSWQRENFSGYPEPRAAIGFGQRRVEGHLIRNYHVQSDNDGCTVTQDATGPTGPTGPVEPTHVLMSTISDHAINLTHVIARHQNGELISDGCTRCAVRWRDPRITERCHGWHS